MPSVEGERFWGILMSVVSILLFHAFHLGDNFALPEWKDCVIVGDLLVDDTGVEFVRGCLEEKSEKKRKKN